MIKYTYFHFINTESFRYILNKQILFLGVGGIGVSALAIAAKRLGANVVGYDSKPNDLTIKLENLGIEIFSNSNEIDVKDYSLVVYSTAIVETHILLAKARQLNIMCLQRASFLAILMKDFKHSIAVTGTHGKTTTSSVLATLMIKLDSKSSFVVGGVVKHTNSNIEVNGSDKLVIEADESDASFLQLEPTTAIVTNIDLDHMETYKNNYDHLLENFYNFITKKAVKDIYLCVDDKGCENIINKYSFDDKNIITYGFSDKADLQIFDYKVLNAKSYFSIRYKSKILEFSTLLPGRYNVLNVAVCIACCLDFGFSYQDIKEALETVAGVNRRFDTYKKTISGVKTIVIDDYGHHPVEVTNSISAVRDLYPNKKIIHVFQPHRYSRNKDLFEDWQQALQIADQLILLPTYSAGENIVAGATSVDMAKNISTAKVVDDFNEAISLLEQIIDDDSVVLVQGAGDITNLVGMLSDS